MFVARISTLLILLCHTLGCLAAEPRWFKGNLHTHSLWSDGDDFPERIATWYRDQGYQFLAISDHNTAQHGEKWVKHGDLAKKGAAGAAEAYLKDFAPHVKVRGDIGRSTQEIRLTPFAEYRPRLEKPGQFILIQSEEISDKFEKHPIHICATNIAQTIKAQGGTSVVDVIRNNMRAVHQQAKELNRPILPHLNHPNFEWGVTAEEMAQVVEERFFEVFNGHPKINQMGDKDHPGVERMWDIANIIRMKSFKSAPMMGLATDDSHNYHVHGSTRAMPGRGWIFVRAGELTPESLIAAMIAGDFYASTGVVLKEVRFTASTKTLEIEIEPDGDARFTTTFIGALTDENRPEPTAPLAVIKGVKASYRLTGKELYVRAMIESDKAPANPVYPNQKKQAWTQPVGWERHIRK